MTASKAVRLYRALLRTAARLPTANHRNFVRQKVRADFRAPLGPGEELAFMLRLGETHLETLELQSAHLTEVIKAPGYHYTEYDLDKGPSKFNL
jgi:hypothetical protein